MLLCCHVHMVAGATGESRGEVNFFSEFFSGRFNESPPESCKTPGGSLHALKEYPLDYEVCEASTTNFRTNQGDILLP